jgi:hypothetical protein
MTYDFTAHQFDLLHHHVTISFRTGDAKDKVVKA